MKKALSILAVLALGATLALAHGDEQHVMGVVKKMTDKSITVETKDKTTVEVMVVPGTKFTKDNAAVTLKDLKEGDRVVVQAKKSGDKLVATTVQIGAASAPAHKQ